MLLAASRVRLVKMSDNVTKQTYVQPFAVKYLVYLHRTVKVYGGEMSLNIVLSVLYK